MIIDITTKIQKCKNATLLPSRKQTPGCLKRNFTIPKSYCLFEPVHNCPLNSP